jgi:hypothetical protein
MDRLNQHSYALHWKSPAETLAAVSLLLLFTAPAHRWAIQSRLAL